MKKDKYKTDIVFRIDTAKDFKGTVFALFPHDVDDYNGNVTCYQHVGQHSLADYRYCIYNSRPAKESEYKALKSEMEGLGYNINIVQRQNYNKYLKPYHKIK